ncbi:hypothetical protein [Halorhabdus sp. CUG00001]|uniref:hypothetical protein n=1 Tax=Halorhabdus sp. CUG00001 TaxID=2600297 RepID=UPI00131A78AA|nr:hypothetical protein [Halorhabdus sp. CUG00001]
MASAVDDDSERADPAHWVLLGGLFVALIAIPWALILLPSVRGVVGGIGLSFRDAYLVVPLVPALGLGALAVWTALRSGGP